MNAQIEKVKMQSQKVKTHFRENKKVYLACTVTAVTTAVGVFVLSNRTEVLTIVDSFKLQLQYKSPTTTLIEMPTRRACMEPIPVRCIETNEKFASIRRAGNLLDVPPNLIGGHLQGKFDSVNGLHFEKLVEDAG